MVDANEKEPRSIRLQGLSECQREREGQRDGQVEGCDKKKTVAERQGRPGSD